MATAPARTVWVFGDQLNRAVGPIGRARPGVDRVLIVESAEHLARRPWHRQRAHLIVAAMRRFARELEAEGFEVDLRRADTYATGLAAHRAAYAPATVVAMAPSSIRGRRLVAALGVDGERASGERAHKHLHGAALQAQHALALLRQPHQQQVDLFLGYGMVIAFLADIDAFCVASAHVEDGRGNQAVVNNHVGLLHQA